MNLENLIPTAGWLLVVAIVVAPTATRLINNLRTGWRTRQHKKNLPGPLLGVVYPEHKDSTILTRKSRED
jgi:hypothetical protein